ncbi:MAG: VCBS repeat-containing protein [Alphaproteobacteria bacterium]|nr:VCBS repeat-containing protein [Alphaproteobacteria bacterium]
MLLLMLACDAGGPALDDTAVLDDTDVLVDTGAPPWTSLSLVPGWTSTEPGYGTGAGWGDIDGDGDPDLIIAYGNDMHRGPLAVYLNQDGVLEESASWTSAEDHYYGHLAVGDVNGDGAVDVAVSRFLGDGRFGDPGGVEVFLNNGGALEDRPAWEAPELFYSFSCALGDVDLDGDLDLAVAVGEAYFGEPDLSRVYLNDGTGDFGASAWTTETPRHAFDVAWADFDDDGWLDLAVANGGSGHTLYLNEGGRLAETPAWIAEGEPEDFEGNTLDWGDVDGDGWLDLVVSDNDQLGGDGTVGLYCGPDLERCWSSADEPAMQSAVSLEDVDGDGTLDLVAGAWWGSVRVYLNRDGLSATPDHIAEPRTVIEAFAWADVDGSHDRVVTLSGDRLVAVPGRARVLSVTGGVAGDGWITGPGAIEAEVLAPAPRDLAVSNWDPNVGNQLFSRE